MYKPSKHLHTQEVTERLPLGAQRFLAVFEGLEGGFAIGAGIVSALAFAHLSKHILVTTAIISIMVNGFNSASVKYSSEHYLDQLDGHEKNAYANYFIPALYEFLAYVFISFVSIIPLFVLDNPKIGTAFTVALTVVILFAAGFWRAHLLKMSHIRDATETAILGTGIILVGALSGYIVHAL